MGIAFQETNELSSPRVFRDSQPVLVKHHSSSFLNFPREVVVDRRTISLKGDLMIPTELPNDWNKGQFEYRMLRQKYGDPFLYKN